MTRPWFLDMRQLKAAEQAREMPRQVPEVVSPTLGPIITPLSEFGAMAGDLDAHAARLGIDVGELVRLRARGRGFHRRPMRPFGEILTALTWRFRR